MPLDNKGIPHILEHMILNGSKKYSSINPFETILKTSLYTYLNAITFHDKTMYIFSTYNLKEFNKILDIYLDGIYNPLLEKNMFFTEGVRQSNNKASGIVFNEMLGVYSNPQEMLKRENLKSLFKNSFLSYDSAGKPEDILMVNYEDVINYFESNYKNSNAILYFYGDLEIDFYLDILDKNFFKLNKNFKKTLIFKQNIDLNQIQNYKKIKNEINYCYYNGEFSYFSANYILNSYFDLRTLILTDILIEYFQEIFKNNEINIFLDKEIYFPVISFVIKNPIMKITDFKSFINNIFKSDINKNLVEHCFRKVKFNNFENFNIYRNLGVIKSFELINFLINDKDPIDVLEKTTIFDEIEIFIKEKNGFLLFLKKYFIDKMELTAFLIDKSVSCQSEIIEKKLQKNYDKYYNDTKCNKNYINKVINHLNIDEIKIITNKIEFIDNKNLYFNIKNKNIFYIKLFFNLTDLQPEEFYYLGLIINLLTDSNIVLKHEVFNEDKNYLTICFSGFVYDLENIIKKIKILVNEYKLDYKHINYKKYLFELETAYNYKSYIFEMNNKLGKYFTQFDNLDKSSYMKFHLFLRNYTNSSNDIINLQNLYNKIFNEKNITISFASSFANINEINKELKNLIITEKIYNNKIIVNKIGNVLLENKNCCVFIDANFMKYSAELLVISTILENEYILQEIRNKNGAYGYGIDVLFNGTLIFYSFDDPLIKESIKIFKNASNYLKNIKISEVEFKKYLMSTLNKIFKPQHCLIEFNNALNDYFNNIDRYNLLLEIKNMKNIFA